MRGFTRAKWALPGALSLVAGILAGVCSGGPWSAFVVFLVLAVLLFGLDFILRELRLWSRPEAYAALAALHRCHNWPEEVRICLYTKCLSKRDRVKQASPYVPSKSYGSGRKGLDSAKGIVGLCFRTGEKCVELVPAGENFGEYMKKNWGFTDKDVNNMQRDRSAYMAIPVLDAEGKTKAVVYLDAPAAHRGVFTDQLSESLQRVAIFLASVV